MLAAFNDVGSETAEPCDVRSPIAESGARCPYRRNKQWGPTPGNSRAGRNGGKVNMPVLNSGDTVAALRLGKGGQNTSTEKGETRPDARDIFNNQGGPSPTRTTVNFHGLRLRSQRLRLTGAALSQPPRTASRRL